MHAMACPKSRLPAWQVTCSAEGGLQDPKRLEDLTGLTKLKEEAARATEDDLAWSEAEDSAAEEDEEFAML